MLKLEIPHKTPINILLLGAHCDDIEIGTGGTLLKLIEAYDITNIKWVVFSSDAIRKKEAVLSANMFLDKIKNKQIIIKDYQDGFMPFMAKEIKNFFEELKTSFNPDIVFTHYRNDRHQDHRLISDLTWNTWRNHLILEYEIPKYDGDMGIPNLFINLEESVIHKKNDILRQAFKSQVKKHWFDADTFKALPRIRGMESATQYAEAFYARKILL